MRCPPITPANLSSRGTTRSSSMTTPTTSAAEECVATLHRYGISFIVTLQGGGGGVPGAHVQVNPFRGTVTPPVVTFGTMIMFSTAGPSGQTIDPFPPWV